MQNTLTGAPTENEAAEAEESWTFIGDEGDPELQKRIQDWDLGAHGRAPRVSLDLHHAIPKALRAPEPVRTTSTKM